METELDRLRKKVENFPSASLYTRLAELSRQSGDEAGAEAACRRCIREFPRSAQAYVILAEMRLAAGARAEAVTLVGTAVEKDPRSYQALRMAADLADSPQAAVRHLQAILAFKPNDPPVLARIAELGGAAAPAPASSPAPVASAPSASAVRPAVPAPALDQPLPMPTPGTGSFRAPAAPKGHALDALCAEAGVRGACVTDVQGRTVAAKNLAGQDELLAALGAEVLRAAGACLGAAGATAPNAFSLTATGGQVLAFTRDRQLTVLVVADPGVRPAMLELRARQALIDLGAGS